MRAKRGLPVCLCEGKRSVWHCSRNVTDICSQVRGAARRQSKLAAGTSFKLGVPAANLSFFFLPEPPRSVSPRPGFGIRSTTCVEGCRRASPTVVSSPVLAFRPIGKVFASFVMNITPFPHRSALRGGRLIASTRFAQDSEVDLSLHFSESSQFFLAEILASSVVLRELWTFGREEIGGSRKLLFAPAPGQALGAKRRATKRSAARMAISKR